ncbi:putative Pkinase domain containing protein,putative [Babesia divergens]|uniref:non-specific serine/threonine protein kinase n=1 Tax=Babesia divergens TaxID=32595 RepID=A0AAD9LGL8_BABDI|nr:putative Pkinase domain containing protein,putative [Babesia divergens]
MARCDEQRHSMASRLQGSASLLLIHSLYGTMFQAGVLSLEVSLPPSHVASGHQNILDTVALIDALGAQHQMPRHHAKHINTCPAASDNFNKIHDTIATGLESHMDHQCSYNHYICENDNVLTPTIKMMHETSNTCHSSSCKSSFGNGGHSIRILPGVEYNISDMVLYLNITISASVITALMCYCAVTLLGLYRFIEVIQEYFMGCSCRICKHEFVIVRDIEGGAYGKIQLARYIGIKQDFDFEVILKSIPIDGVSAISVTQQECRKLLSLNHRYVMKYYDDFLHREWSWNPLVRAKLYCVMVTEFCERGSLADLIEHEYSQFSEEYILNIFKKVVTALQYVHEQSVIHRDIKSPNIMLKSKDVVRLGDFGLSYTFAAKKTYKNVKCGNMLELAAMASRNNRRGGMKQCIGMTRNSIYGNDLFDDDSPYSGDMDGGQENIRADDYTLNHGQSFLNNHGSRPPDYFNIPDVKATNTSKSRTSKRVKSSRKRHNVKPDPWTDLSSYTDSPPICEDINARLRSSPYRNGTQSLNGASIDDQRFRKNSESSTEQIGTRCYMAPEILMYSVYGRPSDIWALGCVLLELCSGVFMWELGYNLGECPEKVRPLVAGLPPMISRDTRSLITKMLSVNAEKRPSAAQILACRCLKSSAKRYQRGDDY